jgi:hypothetical protein
MDTEGHGFLTHAKGAKDAKEDGQGNDCQWNGEEGEEGRVGRGE